MCLAFMEILLRCTGSWELLCGVQTREARILGKDMSVEGRGWWELPEDTSVGSKASEEHGLNPESEGPLGSKWKEGLHCPTSGTEPVPSESGGLHGSRSFKDKDNAMKPELLLRPPPLDAPDIAAGVGGGVSPRWH